MTGVFDDFNGVTKVEHAIGKILVKKYPYLTNNQHEWGEFDNSAPSSSFFEAKDFTKEPVWIITVQNGIFRLTQVVISESSEVGILPKKDAYFDSNDPDFFAKIDQYLSEYGVKQI
jgi:hypothetical protein